MSSPEEKVILSMNPMKKAASDYTPRPKYVNTIERASSEVKIPKKFVAEAKCNNCNGGVKKKSSFRHYILSRTGSLFERKPSDKVRKKPEGLSDIQAPKPRRTVSEAPKPTRSRDSFLERIDWGAVGAVASARTLGEKPIFGNKSFAVPPSTRNRLASAPLKLCAPELREYTYEDSDDETDDKGPSDETYQRLTMSKITKRLYLGNDQDASDEDALRRAKITHVLSMVARKWDKKPRGILAGIRDPALWARTKSIKRKCVPMSDVGNSDVGKLLEEKEVLAFMEESQRKKNKLLVHCQLGQNRSPTIVMAFLMKHDHLTFHKAWRKVKQARVIVQPNKNYVRQLRRWDMYLHGKHSTPENFLQLKVTGEDISVTHEHHNTERMRTVMLKNVQALMSEASVCNAKPSSASSSEEIIIDEEFEVPEPECASGNIFTSTDKLGNHDRTSQYVSYTGSCGTGKNLLVEPAMMSMSMSMSNSEDDSSPVKNASEPNIIKGIKDKLVDIPVPELTIDF